MRIDNRGHIFRLFAGVALSSLIAANFAFAQVTVDPVPAVVDPAPVVSPTPDISANPTPVSTPAADASVTPEVDAFVGNPNALLVSTLVDDAALTSKIRILLETSGKVSVEKLQAVLAGISSLSPVVSPPQARSVVNGMTAAATNLLTVNPELAALIQKAISDNAPLFAAAQLNSAGEVQTAEIAAGVAAAGLRGSPSAPGAAARNQGPVNDERTLTQSGVFEGVTGNRRTTASGSTTTRIATVDRSFAANL